MKLFGFRYATLFNKYPTKAGNVFNNLSKMHSATKESGYE